MHNRSKKFEYVTFSDEQLKAHILTHENLNLLANKLASKLKLDTLRKDHIQSLLSHTNKLNFRELNKNFNGEKKVENINNKIISLFVNKLSTKEEGTDIHELMKKSIGNKPYGVLPEETYTKTLSKKNKEQYDAGDKVAVNDKKYNYSRALTELSMEQLIDFTRIVNFESLWKDSYIIIDSRYRNLANTNLQEVSFNIIQNTKTKIPGTGNIYAHGETKQIVQIEIFPFNIPFVSNADNYYNKVTMSIKEMLPISFEAYEDSQFHFMFNTTESGNLIKLDPINPVFRFYKPITHIGGSFTLRFGSPFAPIEFDKDRLSTISINYITNPIELVFGEDHHLITGDLVYLDDFTTLNPAADIELIDKINRKDGHLCSRINNTTISINIDGTAITSPDSTHSSTVYFGSKRIFIPMRLRYLLGVNDKDS